MAIIPVSHKPDPHAPGTGNRNRTTRVLTCAVLNRTGDRCTAEALADADILICQRHAALVLELIAHAQATQEQQP